MTNGQRVAVGLAAAVGSIGLAAAALGIYQGNKRQRAPGQPLGLADGRSAHPLQAAPQRRERVRTGGMTLTRYDEQMLTIGQRAALLQDLIAKGVKDPQMRKYALEATRACQWRDGLCEAQAIYEWMREPVRDPRSGKMVPRIRYTGDIAPHARHGGGPVEPVDLFQHPRRTVEFGGGDCLPSGTLLLVEGHRLVPIDELKTGMRIWGRDRWTTVDNVWWKGDLPVTYLALNNGSMIRATEEHKIYVARCNQHGFDQEVGSKYCSCPMSERSVERLLIAEAREGMVLVTPDRIPFGDEHLDPDRALIEGFYLADGWTSHEVSFDIAGRDGHPKEAQKRVIQEICQRLGISTYWHDRYIRVKDSAWTKRIAEMGHRAPQKHALSINLDEAAAVALLRGIMADSGKNTHGGGRTFTTTSRALMLQVRLLHKMLGQTCSEHYIVDHGGLGEHPIHRLGVRDPARSDGRAEKLLRIKGIEREVLVLPVYDLTTEDHYVYLPEADVTVSNCDDQAVLAATLATLNGIPARLRISAPSRDERLDDWSHVYAVFGLPKEVPTRWIVVDTTLGKTGLEKLFGIEAAHGKHMDFVA